MTLALVVAAGLLTWSVAFDLLFAAWLLEIGAVRVDPQGSTAALVRRSGVSRVRFYLGTLPHPGASASDFLWWRTVVIDWRLLQQPAFNIDATVAHELGHLACNHPLKKKLLTLGLWSQLRPGARLYQQFEREADAFAAALIGVEVKEEMLERTERIGEQGEIT
jgi:Zn-dependent protease with chaperone function